MALCEEKNHNCGLIIEVSSKSQVTITNDRLSITEYFKAAESDLELPIF